MSSTRPQTITAEFIEEVVARLTDKKRIRRSLPQWGRLHIDRPLPFLCVYRRPVSRADGGTERLALGEAAYLIASGDRVMHLELSELVRAIAGALCREYGGFLIVEIWTPPPSRRNAEKSDECARPAFRIVAPADVALDSTIEALRKSLANSKIQLLAPAVEIARRGRFAPPGMASILPPADAKKLGVRVIGLEVQPVFRSRSGAEVYPQLLRRVHRAIDRSLKRAFFEFGSTHTALQAPNYQALGRRAMVKAVWEVDRRLAEISSAFEFLLYVTPVNAESAWGPFQRSRFEKAPVFHYRPLPVEPAELKRGLYSIPIERVEDPLMTQIFLERQLELDRKLTMLLDRDSPRFFYGSLQVFGGVSDESLALANELLERIPARSRDDADGGRASPQSFANRAEQEIAYYRLAYPDLAARVEIRKDIIGLVVSNGNLYIGAQSKIPARRVEALIQHEIGTHVLTYYNGKSQPFRQLYNGLAGYDELQEGLAVLAEYLAGGLSRPRLRLLAGRVVAVRRLIDGASFIETFRELDRAHEFEQRTAYGVATRIYRGGGLTKDAVYLRGFVNLLRYLKKGGDLETLFVGKFHERHIPMIKELLWRKALKPPPLRPRYMGFPDTAARLECVRRAESVLELIGKGSR